MNKFRLLLVSLFLFSGNSSFSKTFFGIEFYHGYDKVFNFSKKRIENQKTTQKNNILVFRDLIFITSDHHYLYFNLSNPDQIYFSKKINGFESCIYLKGTEELFVLENYILFVYGAPFRFRLVQLDPKLKPICALKISRTGEEETYWTRIIEFQNENFVLRLKGLGHNIEFGSSDNTFQEKYLTSIIEKHLPKLLEQKNFDTLSRKDFTKELYDSSIGYQW